MKDPYEVLGVARDATDDQIKAAYRKLARKYHPDHYDGNPLSDLAQEKMKEINEAYDRIMAERNGKSGQNQYYSGYSPNHANSSFADIRAIISAGRYEDAQVLLDGIPPQKRDAEWYFLNGSVLYRRGWFEDAYTSFATAVRMEPNNPEYTAALNQLNRQRSGATFRTHRTGGMPTGGCSACDVCNGLICADCCCECMGGDLIRCC